MNRRLLIFMIFACIFPVAWGCRANQRTSVTDNPPVSFSVTEADRVWEAIQEALRNRGYRLDRVDRRAGIVTVLPEISQHYFEFWRHDVVTAYDLWESTVNPIRRNIEVVLAPAPPESEEGFELKVTVTKQRLSSPDRQFNTSGAAYQFFGDSLPATTGAARVTAADDQWLDMGRDSALEARLTEEITQLTQGDRPS